MNLWLRLLYVYLTTLCRPRIAAPFGVSSVSLIVLPGDLDVNFHINNGRYLTLMDLGRLDLFLRGGLWQAIRRAGWKPMLSAAAIVFRRELRLWRRFRVESRVVYWEQTSFIMEHRLIASDPVKGDVVAALSLNRGGLYDARAKRFVPVSELFARMGVNAAPPPLSADVRAFLDAQNAMRQLG